MHLIFTTGSNLQINLKKYAGIGKGTEEPSDEFR